VSFLRQGLQPALGHGATPEQEQVRVSGKPVFRRRDRQHPGIALPVTLTHDWRRGRDDGDDSLGNLGGGLQQPDDLAP